MEGLLDPGGQGHRVEAKGARDVVPNSRGVLRLEPDRRLVVGKREEAEHEMGHPKVGPGKRGNLQETSEEKGGAGGGFQVLPARAGKPADQLAQPQGNGLRRRKTRSLKLGLDLDRAERAGTGGAGGDGVHPRRSVPPWDPDRRPPPPAGRALPARARIPVLLPRPPRGTAAISDSETVSPVSWSVPRAASTRRARRLSRQRAGPACSRTRSRRARISWPGPGEGAVPPPG